MEPLQVYIYDIEDIYVAMQFDMNHFERCLQLAWLSSLLLSPIQDVSFVGLLTNWGGVTKKPSPPSN